MSECVLKTYDIVKIYGGQKVLNQVNMTVNKGDIYGFVGENGSGKTTIIRILSGLIRPNAGSFELFGVKSNDPKIYEVRRKLGAVVESPSIYPALNARDNLKELSLILGINDEEKIKKTLELVGLGSMYDNPKKAVDYSLGMRQRLGIAMALLSDAEFMVLDEPLNGVDPEGIVGLRNLILNLNKEKGITFLISSHILSELSLVATKYGIISKGHLLKEITKEELDAVCKKCIIIDTLEKDKLYEALLTLTNKENIEETETGYRVFEELNLKALFALLANIEVTNIQTVSSTNIEDYYLSVIRGGKK